MQDACTFYCIHTEAVTVLWTSYNSMMMMMMMMMMMNNRAIRD